jgi:hypothetical protein
MRAKRGKGRNSAAYHDCLEQLARREDFVLPDQATLPPLTDAEATIIEGLGPDFMRSIIGQSAKPDTEQGRAVDGRGADRPPLRTRAACRCCLRVVAAAILICTALPIAILFVVLGLLSPTTASFAAWPGPLGRMRVASDRGHDELIGPDNGNGQEPPSGFKSDLLTGVGYHKARFVDGGKLTVIPSGWPEGPPGLTVSGDGYVIFEAPPVRSCRVTGRFTLRSGSMGYAVCLHVQETSEGDQSKATELECLAVNFDMARDDILVKEMPQDQTLVRLLQPQGSRLSDIDPSAEHQLIVESNGRGLYTVTLDGTKIGSAHHYGNERGKVAIRVWGGSVLDVRELQVEYLALPGRPRPAGFGVDLVVASVGTSPARGHLPRLPQVLDDATLLRSRFRQGLDGKLYDLDFLDEDVAQDKLAHVLSSRLDHAGPDDVLVVYLSGHGAIVNGSQYLITPRTSLSSVASFQRTSIEIRSLVGALSLNKHKLVVLIIDTYTDKRLKLRFPEGSKPPVDLTATLAACLAQSDLRHNAVIIAPATERPVGTDRAPFSAALLDAVGGKADRDRDGRVSLGEVVAYLCKHDEEGVQGRPGVVVTDNWKDFKDEVICLSR